MNKKGSMKIVAAGLCCTLDPHTGRIIHLRHEPAGDDFIHPDGRPGGLEVYDELDRQWYSDLVTPSAISDFCAGDGQVSFVKHFGQAPFVLRCRWRADRWGLNLEVEVELLPGATMRSIRISLALPTTPALASWAPSYPAPSDVLANPVHYCYLADEKGKARTGIPMLTLYHPGRGGLSMAIPLDVPKVQLNMGVEPADPCKWYVPEHVPRINAGTEVDTVSPPERHDLGADPVIRFTEKHVGPRPGRPLRFALWLFGHAPDWRVGLGRLVERYADYFQPQPASLALAGSCYGANPEEVSPPRLEKAKGFGVTHAWFHGHFEYHGEFLTDQALTDPSYHWFCEPYKDWFGDLSLEGIRGQISLLKAAGIASFMYGFNMHCDETIIAKRGLAADVARGEDGQVARSYHDQPVMFFDPNSPFGRQQLDQAARLMRIYPEAIGLALDNWNYTGIDFGHDDGVTMVNNRPAASINFAQQRMIRAIADLMHGSGRLVMTNKGRTIESMRGVDMVVTEAVGAETFATFAYMNMFRNVIPCEYDAGKDPKYAEEVLKYLLVWGGQMGHFERQADAEQARAYQALLAHLRNRRWVFAPDPLTLPEGTQGQVFRIDERSPFSPGAVVVTIVRPSVSCRDGSFREGLSVGIRLDDTERFKRAWWLSVERAGGQGPETVATECPVGRRRAGIEVPLPPVGAAGVLRLS